MKQECRWEWTLPQTCATFLLEVANIGPHARTQISSELFFSAKVSGKQFHSFGVCGEPHKTVRAATAATSLLCNPPPPLPQKYDLRFSSGDSEGLAKILWLGSGDLLRLLIGDGGESTVMLGCDRSTKNHVSSALTIYSLACWILYLFCGCESCNNLFRVALYSLYFLEHIWEYKRNYYTPCLGYCVMVKSVERGKISTTIADDSSKVLNCYILV